jgi:hypothetical protein
VTWLSPVTPPKEAKIIVVPTLTPVTTPAFTLATAGTELDHSARLVINVSLPSE